MDELEVPLETVLRYILLQHEGSMTELEIALLQVMADRSVQHTLSDFISVYEIVKSFDTTITIFKRLSTCSIEAIIEDIQNLRKEWNLNNPQGRYIDDNKGIKIGGHTVKGYWELPKE